MWAFSSCCGRASCCSLQAFQVVACGHLLLWSMGSRARGLSSCSTWAQQLQDTGSLVAILGFSCPLACGILVTWLGIKPANTVLEGRFLATGLPGKSLSQEFDSFSSYLGCWSIFSVNFYIGNETRVQMYSFACIIQLDHHLLKMICWRHYYFTTEGAWHPYQKSTGHTILPKAIYRYNVISIKLPKTLKMGRRSK